MKIVSLNCNHCGAPLDVPAKAKFVTCAFCESRLQIHHTGNTYSTEVLEELVRKTDSIHNEVQNLKRQNALLALDRDWDNQRKRFQVTDKHGRTSIPGSFDITVAAVAGLFITVIAFGVAGPLGMKADNYKQAKRRYQQRRRRLMFDDQRSDQRGAW